MKVYQIQSGQLTLVEQEMPHLADNEVLVKIEAVSLNYRDVLVVEGNTRWKPTEDNRVPVSDGAGTVIAVGNQVKALKQGDRVTSLIVPNWQDGTISPEKLQDSPGGPGADGVLAEYVVFPETAVIRFPDYLSFQEASALPCAGLTAWNAIVEQSTLKPGHSVLILGTGGVSIFAIQFALMAGCRVIVTSSSDEKLQQAKALGVHHTINYAKIPNWEEQVLELTHGEGVDQVIEVVGGAHLNRSARCVRSGGTISQIGVIGGIKGEIDTAEIMYKAIRLQGIETGSKSMHQRMLQAMELHQMRPIIHKVFDFKDALEAVHYLKAGNHFGKVIVQGLGTN